MARRKNPLANELVFAILIGRNCGMAKAAQSRMNYYEQLVKRMNQSMKAHPRSAMAMDMGSFEIIAKAPNFRILAGRLQRSKNAGRSVIFQKPGEKVTWIL
ncbi:MAG: hypothetical protein KGJ88_06570 [Verrucomicrobiota bacterium]|nr:hypothetical protein [Verrucomicrobiota bacterium]